MRTIAPVLCLFWLLAVGARSWVVLRFELDRDRIVREECVQRDVPDALRTCYGRCQLIKALNELREQEQHGAPLEITVKWEPEATAQDDLNTAVATNKVVGAMRPAPAAKLLSGCLPVPEGVPRS